MSAYLNWNTNPAWDRRLLALKESGAVGGLKVRGRAFQDIARLMNEWFDTDVFTKDNVQKRYQTMVHPSTLAQYPKPDPAPYFSEHFDDNGKLRYPAPQKADWRQAVSELEDSGRYYKTLVLSDQQGLFCDEGLLELAMADHPDADLIVFPGDVCEWEAASRFVHTADYPILLESDWYIRQLTAACERWPNAQIIVTGSNHRRRIENAIRQLPQSLLFLAEHNPEKYLAQPFPRVHSLEEWWVQIGDAIYAHKEGKTSNAGDNGRDAIDTFNVWMRSGQFPVTLFRTVVTGHSHKLGEGFHDGVKWMEPGTLAKVPMSYMRGASVKSVQMNGYAVVVQRGGLSDWNESRTFHLPNLIHVSAARNN